MASFKVEIHAKYNLQLNSRDICLANTKTISKFRFEVYVSKKMSMKNIRTIRTHGHIIWFWCECVLIYWYLTYPSVMVFELFLSYLLYVYFKTVTFVQLVCFVEHNIIIKSTNINWCYSCTHKYICIHNEYTCILRLEPEKRNVQLCLSMLNNCIKLKANKVFHNLFKFSKLISICCPKQKY